MSFTLRVNVGEQCQLECGYCRPSLAAVTCRPERLTPADYARLAAALAEAPPTKVRFTGGEPLLRDDFAEIVAAFRRSLPGVPLAVTTNGAMLPAQLTTLVRAGLTAVTVHLDSLWPDRYRALMGGGELSFALRGVAVARERLGKVKVNVVVQRGRNDDELLEFLDWSSRDAVEVRFIELMNTGSAGEFTARHFIAGAEVVQRLAAVPLPRRSSDDPAALFRARGVTFGVISSDTTPFCAACNRLRLSPSGALRGCLYAPRGVELGPVLRSGDLTQVRAALELARASKQSHHPSQPRAREPFSMAAIGG